MEDLNEKIKRFLSVGDGSGSGRGSGSGSGYGSGRGSGRGSGDGYGSGYGRGDGYCSGSGSGRGYGSGEGSGYGSGEGSGDGYGYGYGDGDGYGYGYGSGYGYGDGSGDGYGCGYCYGSGDGYGDGSGYGIKEYDGKPVYIIDGVPTILTNVVGNIAKGYVVREDLSLHSCFVARSGDCFAHGVTSREALLDARAKYEENLPEEERRKLFIERYPSLDSIAACSDLFRWHHTLTGSCTMGRKEFVAAHGIDVEKDSMTVGNFIALTRDSFGGDVIKKLAEEYKARQSVGNSGSNPTPEEG